MIRTTYKGRDIKILKSTTSNCVKTFVGGHVISHAWQGDEIQALDWFRREIDRIDAKGPGSNPQETLPHWYAPGTFDLNGRGHVIAPGGACTCNTCLASPEKNVPCTDTTACQHCPIPQATHARQFTELVGWHPWVAPTPEQIKGRMQARRAARQETS
ncbi:hypothetical protein [Actinacidiphila sp. ITFR-21]|uniref:hypothetical protein n=1 Tax=Actinacidiphila sp. ITFR-21 TaxID=3075199 RepID=UPI00288A1F23|nr:hypothetical protein [Streptomyces sp. ITFR-21]WNI19205.1 hypothetical protein RLT57_29120 [Streptomyces sp. ITFR-21]